MERKFYRIQSAVEPLDSLLNPSRKDGRVASDESTETQPHGISCCSSLENLYSYIKLYSLNIQPGDLLVELTGSLSYDRDRDQYAERCIVTSYEVLGDAREWFSSADY